MELQNLSGVLPSSQPAPSPGRIQLHVEMPARENQEDTT